MFLLYARHYARLWEYKDVENLAFSFANKLVGETSRSPDAIPGTLAL